MPHVHYHSWGCQQSFRSDLSGSRQIEEDVTMLRRPDPFFQRVFLIASLKEPDE